MRKTRFIESQVVGILKDGEAGVPFPSATSRSLTIEVEGPKQVHTSIG